MEKSLKIYIICVDHKKLLWLIEARELEGGGTKLKCFQPLAATFFSLEYQQFYYSCGFPWSSLSQRSISSTGLNPTLSSKLRSFVTSVFLPKRSFNFPTSVRQNGPPPVPRQSLSSYFFHCTVVTFDFHNGSMNHSFIPSLEVNYLNRVCLILYQFYLYAHLGVLQVQFQPTTVKQIIAIKQVT